MTQRTPLSADLFAKRLLRGCLVMSMLLAVAFCAPGWYRQWKAAQAPHEPVPLGRVLRILYVKGLLHPYTQVDTDQRSLLLQGVVLLEPGLALEWRRNYPDEDVCVTGTERCWYWMGSDEDKAAIAEKPVRSD